MKHIPILQNLAEQAKAYEAWKTEQVITWCSGCGNFGILNSVMRALVLEKRSVQDTVFCFDVGCNGNVSDKINGYTIHGLHGRVTSLAAGASVANENMKVIAFAGDGATFSEGPGHLMHSVRNNYNVLFVHHNNENYGLTIGQASALTRVGMKMNGTPNGVVVPPLNPCDFVMSMSPSFVARVLSSDVDHLTAVLQEAIRHDGFAFIDVLQTCPTFNRETTDDWYAQRIWNVDEDPSYDPSDFWKARQTMSDLDEKIATGILYRNPQRLPFMATQAWRKPESFQPLVHEVQRVDIEDLY